MTKKGKDTLKILGFSVLGALVLFGGVSLVKTIVDDTRADNNGLVEVHPSFEKGGLDEYGRYVKSDSTLYTKEAFACDGLEIKIDFDNTINYEVFYYTETDEFISSSGLLSEHLFAELPENAVFARIEITPDWKALKITETKKQVIHWYDVNKYAKQLKIKVLETKDEKNVLDDKTISSSSIAQVI